MVFHAEDKTTPPKAFFTHGVLPAFVDDKQVPQKRKPFSTILNKKWSHTMDIILPEEILEIVQPQLDLLASYRYAKVMMSLGELLKGDFFTEYIKRGNILMLSEGRPGVDNLYSLHEGVLRLELDKATYERAGLTGQPIRDGGLKHKNNRYAIELDLRRPSMLHGKKGFERIVWACNRVLNNSLTWLFCDVENKLADNEAPIAKHHPLWVTAQPQVTRLHETRTPSLAFATEQERLEVFKDNIFSSELEEWIGLVALESPRLQTNDTIDPYLCRYSIPIRYQDDALPSGDVAVGTVEELVRLRWHGFIPSAAVIALFIGLRKESRNHWTAVLLHGFRDDSLTIMKLPIMDNVEQYLEWEHPARL